MTEERWYRARVVIGTGPLGGPRRDLGDPITADQDGVLERYGIELVSEEAQPFTQDSSEDLKVAVTVVGTSAEGVVGYFEEVVRLGRDEPGWLELERQVARPVKAP